MLWSPFEIEIILHHHYSLAPFPRESAPAYQGILDRLVESGILQPHEEKGAYVTTSKGNALVCMWCDTPEPVQKYLDPRFE